jgi:uncharacterized protein
MTYMKRILVFIFLFISFCGNSQIDKVIPKKPVPPKLVNDFADMLTPEQEHALENKLVAYNDSTSSQIAVVTVESLEGYEDEEFALAIGREWGVGGRDFNNGVIILISEQDRKSRIEVGYGLEGAIPDITAKTIIDHDLTPNFREGNYYRGLDRSTDALIRAAAGEYKAPEGQQKGKRKGIGFGAIIVFLILWRRMDIGKLIGRCLQRRRRRLVRRWWKQRWRIWRFRWRWFWWWWCKRQLVITE